jgi:uncharacterized membrane protein
LHRRFRSLFFLCAPNFRPVVSRAKARRRFSFRVFKCAHSWFDSVLFLLPSQSKSIFLCCFAALTLGFVLGLDSAVSLALVAISDLCLGEYPVSHYDFSTRFFSPVAWISQLSPVLVPQCMHRVSSRFSFFSRSFSLCQSWVIQSELLVSVAVSHAQARSVVAQDQSGSIFHWG